MEKIIEDVMAIKDLPSPPGIALRLLELYEQPQVELEAIAAVIEADPALVARLIQYCNSPLFAKNRETETILQAIRLLGTRPVQILSLSFSLVQTTPSQDDGNQFDYDAFWNRSFANAVIAREICQSQKNPGDEEFLMALMMGIGQLGLAIVHPEIYSQLIRRADEEDVALIELERERWQVSHLEVSRCMLERWNFPGRIINAIANLEKHLGNQSTAQAIDVEDEQLKVLLLAREVSTLFFMDNPSDTEMSLSKRMATHWFGIDEIQFVQLFENAGAKWMEFARLLKYDTSASATISQLLRRANRRISEMSIALNLENETMREENEELKLKATIDSLTGLKNRRAFDEEAEAEHERVRRLSKPLVLIMVDIDKFKSINDTHGHAVGDQALAAVANVLSRNVRSYDTVYRLGGEEFCIVVPECPPQWAVPDAERLRESIEQLEIPLKKKTLKLTASFGVSVYDPEAPKSIEGMLEEADAALYEAKDAGRNCVRLKSSLPT